MIEHYRDTSANSPLRGSGNPIQEIRIWSRRLQENYPLQVSERLLGQTNLEATNGFRLPSLGAATQWVKRLQW